MPHRAITKRMRAAGLCVKCGEPNDRLPFWRCTKCIILRTKGWQRSPTAAVTADRDGCPFIRRVDLASHHQGTVRLIVRPALGEEMEWSLGPYAIHTLVDALTQALNEERRRPAAELVEFRRR